MAKLKLVVFVLLLSVVVVQAQESSTYLFFEDFSDNSNDWETADSSTIFSDIVDGEYVIDRAETEIGWFVTPGFTDLSLRPQFTPPYEVSVDITGFEADIGYLCVGLYAGVANDYSATHQYSICSEGRWVVNNESEWLAGGMLDDCLLAPYDETLKLNVQIWDDYHVMYLNGEMIGVIPAPDDFRRGSVGIIADPSFSYDSTSYRATFDNVAVRRLDPANQPDNLAANAFVPYENRLTTVFVAEGEDLAWFIPATWNIYEYEGGAFVMTSGYLASGRYIDEDPLLPGDVILDLVAVPASGDPESSIDIVAEAYADSDENPSIELTIQGHRAVAVTVERDETAIVFTDGEQVFFSMVTTAIGDFENVLPLIIDIFSTIGDPDPVARYLAGDALPLEHTYTNDDSDFSFEYPVDWMVEETYRGGTIYIYNQTCRATTNTEPGMAYADLRYEPISTYAPDLNPLEATVEDVLQSYIDYMDAEYGSLGDSFIEVVTIDGVDVAFDYSTDSWMTVTTIIALTDNGYVGEWTLWNERGEVQMYLPTVLAMAASLTSNSSTALNPDLPRRYDDTYLGFTFDYPLDWLLWDDSTYTGATISNGIRQTSRRVEIRIDRHSPYDLDITSQQNRQLNVAIVSYVEMRGLHGFEETPTRLIIDDHLAYRLDHSTNDDVVYAIAGNGYYNLYVHVSGGGIADNQETIDAIIATLHYSGD